MTTKATTVRLPRELADELDAVARADRLPVSELDSRGGLPVHRRPTLGARLQGRLKEVVEEDRKTLERLAA